MAATTRPPITNKSICVVGLDFDNCLGNDAFVALFQILCQEKGGPDKVTLSDLATIIKQANPALLAHLKEIEKNYGKIILTIVSNRQDFATEFKNRDKKGNGYACLAMQALKAALKEEIGVKVECELHTIADSFLQNQRETLLPTQSAQTTSANDFAINPNWITNGLVLQEKNQLFQNSKKRDQLIEDHFKEKAALSGNGAKAAFLVSQLHRVATAHPEYQIDAELFDDKIDNLNQAKEAFQNNQGCFPLNMKKVSMLRYTENHLANHVMALYHLLLSVNNTANKEPLLIMIRSLLRKIDDLADRSNIAPNSLDALHQLTTKIELLTTATPIVFDNAILSELRKLSDQLNDVKENEKEDALKQLKESKNKKDIAQRLLNALVPHAPMLVGEVNIENGSCLILPEIFDQSVTKMFGKLSEAESEETGMSPTNKPFPKIIRDLYALPVYGIRLTSGTTLAVTGNEYSESFYRKRADHILLRIQIAWLRKNGVLLEIDNTSLLTFHQEQEKILDEIGKLTVVGYEKQRSKIPSELRALHTQMKNSLGNPALTVGELVTLAASYTNMLSAFKANKINPQRNQSKQEEESCLQEQQEQNRVGALAVIEIKLKNSFGDASSKGIVKIKATFDKLNKNAITNSDALMEIKAVANERLQNLFMKGSDVKPKKGLLGAVGNFVKKTRDTESQNFYEAIKNLDATNPDVNALKASLGLNETSPAQRPRSGGNPPS